MHQRSEVTTFLENLLIKKRFSGMGKYWAKEVSIDPFTAKGKGGRVDFMQFKPPNQYALSALEKGIFICYEVKSCKEDVYSGNGLNFYGEQNYVVTTMQCYKDLMPDLRDGTFYQHVMRVNPESSAHYGFMVPIPIMRSEIQELEDPTEISEDVMWEMRIIKPCTIGPRNKSLTELLFCMVRSGHNYRDFREEQENDYDGK